MTFIDESGPAGYDFHKKFMMARLWRVWKSPRRRGRIGKMYKGLKRHKGRRRPLCLLSPLYILPIRPLLRGDFHTRQRRAIINFLWKSYPAGPDSSIKVTVFSLVFHKSQLRFQVPGDRRTSMGNSSSLPASISNMSTVLDR